MTVAVGIGYDDLFDRLGGSITASAETEAGQVENIISDDMSSFWESGAASATNATLILSAAQTARVVVVILNSADALTAINVSTDTTPFTSPTHSVSNPDTALIAGGRYQAVFILPADVSVRSVGITITGANTRVFRVILSPLVAISDEESASVGWNPIDWIDIGEKRLARNGSIYVRQIIRLRETSFGLKPLVSGTLPDTLRYMHKVTGRRRQVVFVKDIENDPQDSTLVGLITNTSLLQKQNMSYFDVSYTIRESV